MSRTTQALKVRYGDPENLLRAIERRNLARALLAADAPCDNPQAYRQQNYMARPTAHDEPLPHNERGVGTMPPPVPEQEAVDESTDLDTGYTNKSAISPNNAGKSASGETRIRSTREGPENSTSINVNKIVKDAINAAMKNWNYDEMLSIQNKGKGCDVNVGGPAPFSGEPLRGGGMRGLTGDQKLGAHIGEVTLSYSPDEASRPRPAYSQYSIDLAEASRAGLNPRMAHDAALALAADRAGKRNDKPSEVFRASGADKIGFAA